MKTFKYFPTMTIDGAIVENLTGDNSKTEFHGVYEILHTDEGTERTHLFDCHDFEAAHDAIKYLIGANSNFYEDQLSQINLISAFCPTIKIQGNGTQTKWMNLNKESAVSLIKWLVTNMHNLRNEND